jgi:hypothetical protein
MLLVVFAMLGVLVLYSPARADQTIRCESEHFELKRCPVDTRGEVQLVRQLSDTPCRHGLTWGYDRRGIWVDEGCGGIFRVLSRRVGRDYDYYGYGRDYGRDYDYDRYYDYGYGRSGRAYERGPYRRDYGREYPWFSAGQTVRCESEHFNYNRCPVDTRGEVRLVRQLSDAPCRRGETWGYDRRGIWVDEGCAGEFQISRR